MKKPTASKPLTLQLVRETIRALADRDVVRVVGGASNPTIDPCTYRSGR